MKLTQTKDGSYLIVLPIALVRAKGWQKGELLECRIGKDGDLIIKSIK